MLSTNCIYLTSLCMHCDSPAEAMSKLLQLQSTAILLLLCVAYSQCQSKFQQAQVSLSNYSALLLLYNYYVYNYNFCSNIVLFLFQVLNVPLVPTLSSCPLEYRRVLPVLPTVTVWRPTAQSAPASMDITGPTLRDRTFLARVSRLLCSNCFIVDCVYHGLQQHGTFIYQYALNIIHIDTGIGGIGNRVVHVMLHLQ